MEVKAIKYYEFIEILFNSNLYSKYILIILLQSKENVCKQIIHYNIYKLLQIIIIHFND